ncbi:transposase family protein [Singulisphaera acidiphila]|uniref:transposase family protein n=1 Tax=Singulisphaera acidiphila TaxID=466153 RepID=UPI0002470BE9|nr:transposase family protein [Singulisphaera acidiphila]
MSTSLLYHPFGVRDDEYTRTDYQGGQTIFTIHQAPETYHCSACGSPQVHSRGRVERRFRTVPLGSRPTFVVLPIPRGECQACVIVRRQIKISFANPRRSYTASFERYARELSRSMTIRDVTSVGTRSRTSRNATCADAMPSSSSSTCDRSPSTS